MKSLGALGMLSLVLIVISCSGYQANPSTLNSIIGENDLKKTSDQDLEEKHGLLRANDRECNSFLSAPDQVTTALHCVGNDPMSFIGFTYTSISGKTANIVDIALLDDQKDVISYSLDRKYERHYTISTTLDQAKPLSLIAFDFDNEHLVQDTCAVGSLLVDYGAFEHKCDTKKKFSGSPLLQDGKVVGLHIGFNPIKNVNYALNFNHLYNDSSDIAPLEIDAELEWPHIRSPHIRVPHIRGSKQMSVCGVGFSVSVLVYAACSATTASIPPACTGMAAASAGSSCAVSIGTAAEICGVSVNTIKVAAIACIASSVGITPGDLKVSF